MGGWIDGYVGGRLGGWVVNKWTDGWMDGRTDELICLTNKILSLPRALLHLISVGLGLYHFSFCLQLLT